MDNSCQHGFVIQPYRRKYLNEYYRRMSQDRDKVLYDDNVASVLKEQGYRINESPRSIYRVSKLYEALDKYRPGNRVAVDITDENIKRGISFAYTQFSCPKGQEKLKALPFTPETIISITSNRSGSAGLTAWGQTKAESVLRAHQRGIQTLKGLKSPEPCIAFTRTQFNEKTRLVWGYPYSMTAIEGTFARPLIKKFLKHKTSMAFGLSTLEIGTRLRISSYQCKYAYSTDYSGYDSSIPKELIVVAFNILSTWFNLEDYEPVTGIKLKYIWSRIMAYFINTPIVMPDGNLYKGKNKGIPSGSYFTQLVGSIVNTIILGAISSEFSLNVASEHALLLGDDVLYWSNRKVNQNHIANYITRTFGIKTNGSKSGFYLYNQPVHFLGRDWDRGIPSLSQEKILERMAFVESFRKYSKDKLDREREVRMLLLSYASVYYKAFEIYIKTLEPFNKYNVSNMSIEKYVYSRGRDYNYRKELDPTMLSGLSRFQAIYLRGKDSWESPPLALQFLK